jgi:hypothetical protein
MVLEREREVGEIDLLGIQQRVPSVASSYPRGRAPGAER